ncbi:MAG: hypothetical protein KatS3mg011_1028 [Acidimicrobiia bacterium]|nr:MAG: hypothetical protein KatS3mg011_1028 [Acidimicrobiia bacterium]
MIWLAVAVSFVGLVWLGQRRLIYLPDRSLPSPPAEVTVVEFTTEDGVPHRGWWVPAETGPVGTVVVFNGNAGNKAGRLPLARRLAERGADVLLFDYRGYGDTPGAPSEEGLVADGRAAAVIAEGRSRGPVVYFGESLGAAVAVGVAAEHPPAGLVLRSPFTSLVDVGRFHYPFLPVGLLLRDRFPVVDLAEGIDAPVVVVLGTGDRVVPPEQSRRVADAFAARVVEVPGADHNDPELAWGPKVVDAVASLFDLGAQPSG